MNLIKTSLLNGIAVVVKMLTLLGINKILAVYVGPSGYAAIGQFQNAVQIITTLASGAINTGVTKYTAEYYDDEVRQKLVWGTAGTITLICSFTTAIMTALFSKELALYFLKDEYYQGVFLWFAATLTLFMLNTLLLAILNGKKEVVLYVQVNIWGSLFSLVVTSLMAIKFGVYGALVALAVHQSLSFFVTLILCYRTSWFNVRYLFGKIEKKVAFNLSKFIAMAATSAACIPASQILIRNHVGESFSWEIAGYWEAMWRLSAAYLMFVTTTLSIYYLPRLSEIKDLTTLKKEIINGYKFILPIACVFGTLIYLTRDIIIKLLFTTDFAPMRELFAWQVIGDTLKIASWILAYVMLGKALVKLFIFSEIIFATSYVCLSYILIGQFGIEGIGVAHAINYFFYWIVMACFIKRSLS